MGFWGINLFISFSFLFAYADLEKHSLNWPIEISTSNRKVGPIFHQYQKFPGSLAYFHEGIDLLGPAGLEIFAPVAGFVDAGYYAYTNNPDGSSKKEYLSIRDIDPKDQEHKLWGEFYFEVSLTTQGGHRIEIHHINRKSLPESILQAIYSREFIFQDRLLGSIIQWPRNVLAGDYSHIHYSILSPEGEQLNPMWFSQKLTDTTAPKIKAVYYQLEQACPETGRVDHLFTSTLNEGHKPTHIIIKATDSIDDNKFNHSPTAINVNFADGSEFNLDFSYSLYTEAGHNTTLKIFF